MLLQVNHLDVGVGDVPLLRDVHLKLEAGELIALSGPSGCGKTTLLRTVAGLIDPLGGEILFKGRSVAAVGYPGYRRQAVLVSQKPVLLDANVQANLERPFRYRSAHKRFEEQRARELLGQVGIEAERLGQQAWSLSVGQQQRVCLVRALLLEPPALLLDEPTSALDSESAVAVENLIRRQAREHGLAALVVAHDRQQPERWCDTRYDLRPHAVQRPAEGGVRAADRAGPEGNDAR
jgi:putative ABC transport system ATP-binding protein